MIDPSKKDTIDVVGKWINWQLDAGKTLNFTERTLTVTTTLGLLKNVTYKVFSCDSSVLL